ncbi:MAG: 50S ribosomal protein L34e [Candidatus Helarchaeota archaeon]|nr:50S ribosomal protein L34e [Candidatus Helarchaeota archaeon]
MPAPRYRSRSKKRKNITTPGRTAKIHYQKHGTSLNKCAGCGIPIKSIPRLRGPNIHKVGKATRRPNRKYGGYYCPTCLRKRIKSAVRKSLATIEE